MKKTGKYKTRKILNYPHNPEVRRYSVDVYYEDDSRSEFICSCGDWDNQTAHYYAGLIVALLSAATLATLED